MIGWLLPTALAGGLYATAELDRSSIDAVRKERRELAKELDEAGLVIELVPASGTPEVVSAKSERVWDPTVIVLRDTLDQFEEGVERDLVLHADGTKVQTLQVRWEPGKLEVVQGRPRPPLLPPGPSTAELAESYGITLKGEWDPLARGVLQAALEVLTPTELAAVSDLVVMRLDGPTVVQSGKEDTVAGQYFYAGELGPRIELYDHAVRPSIWFVGDPRTPQVQAVKTMVHELAHAIDHAPQRRLVAAMTEASGAVSAYERELATQLAAGAEADVLDAIREQHRRAIERQRSLSDSPWMSQGVGTSSYEAAVTGELAPTEYGRRNASEGFAELFALSRLDPQATERVCPEGMAWARSDALETQLKRALAEVQSLVEAPH